MNSHGWKVPNIYLEGGKKVVPNSFWNPALSFFLLSCVLGTKNVAKFAQGGRRKMLRVGEFFLRTSLANKNMLRVWINMLRASKKKHLCMDFLFLFHNFMFLKILPPLAEILKPPLCFFIKEPHFNKWTYTFCRFIQTILNNLAASLVKILLETSEHPILSQNCQKKLLLLQAFYVYQSRCQFFLFISNEHIVKQSKTIMSIS